MMEQSLRGHNVAIENIEMVGDDVRRLTFEKA